jgi:hypothetical protein
MSEKLQHTAARMREQMENRYGDGLHHKHNKLHISYRQHCRSHPSQVLSGKNFEQEKDINCSTGLLHEMKLRKIRKRLDKGRFH